MNEMTKSCLPKSRLIDLTGMVFNKLTMISYVGPCKHGGSFWTARCECGNEIVVRGYYAKSGHTTSCGCHVKDMLKKANTIHGESQSEEHAIWRKMIQRCECKTDKSYGRYGGRGIKVHPRWKKFKNFLADMGRRPSKNHSIDRIDFNGDYEPSNCRWATQNVQSNNKRNNVYLSVGGLRLTAAQFSKVYNLPAARIISRKTLLNWSDRDAIFKPPAIRNQSWRMK